MRRYYDMTMAFMRTLWARVKPIWDRAGFYVLVGASLTLIAGAAIYARVAVAPGETPSVETDLQADYIERLGQVSTPEPSRTPLSTPSPTPTETPPPIQLPLIGGLVGPYAYPYPMYWPTLNQWGTHEGVDIAAINGTAVYAAAQGKVTAVYADSLLGNTVVLSHDNDLTTKYSGLSGLKLPAVGTSITAGDAIGAVSASAQSEANLGSHLHFEIWQDGHSVDPAEFIRLD